nr:hypothetical protein [Methylomonas methanica]
MALKASAPMRYFSPDCHPVFNAQTTVVVATVWLKHATCNFLLKITHNGQDNTFEKNPDPYLFWDDIHHSQSDSGKYDAKNVRSLDQYYRLRMLYYD